MDQVIDSHHHLWSFSKEEYPWIREGMEVLAQDFLPQDLEHELVSSGVGGTIAVQARQTVRETEWLLDLAENSELIRGVVGWAPLAGREFPEVIERLSQNKKVKGFRHVVQDEPDDEFLLREDFNAGVALCKRYALVYDILVYERQLPVVVSLVDRHPGQIFVVDHIAKPRIRERVMEPWRTNMRALARRENTYCKVSGLATEADWKNWRFSDLKPYLEVVLEVFGPQRLMVGSDWPVCLLATTPQTWFATIQEFIRPLTEAEQQMILGVVARKVYSIDSTADMKQ